MMHYNLAVNGDVATKDMPIACCSGISGFSNVNRTDIEAALPVLKLNGVPYLIHAELPEDIEAQVN